MRIQSRKTIVSTVVMWFMALGVHAQIFFDFSRDQAPSGTELFGNARIADDGTGLNQCLHLTDTIVATNGHFRISNIGDGKVVKAATIQWRSLIGGGDNGGADGYSLNWATNLPVTPSIGDPGEEGAGSGLTVTVDTFDNGGGEAPGIEVRWQSNVVIFTSVNKDDLGGGATYLRKSQFVEAKLTVDTRGEAKFTYDGVTLTAVLDGWRGIKGGDLLFGARTGGASDNHWIDDLRVATGMFTAGAFNGLFSDAGVQHERSGFVNLKLTAKGGFSGYIVLGGRRYSLRGAFHPTNLTAAIGITSPSFTPISVELTLTDRETILGRVTDGVWVAPLEAHRQVWNKKLNPALQHAASYTAIIGNGSMPTQPHGYGYGTYKVDLGGNLKFSGKLGEGSPATQSVPLSKDGRWALFFLTHRGKGSVLGWVNTRANEPLATNVVWFKGAAAGGPLYPSGFHFEPFFFSLPYVPPPPGTRIVDVASGKIEFRDGDLLTTFSNEVGLTPENVVTNKSANRLTMKFKPSAGSFTGTVNVPGTNRVIKFGGVVSTVLKVGAGHFIGQTQSGSVVFSN